jgi:hypothetical protein
MSSETHVPVRQFRVLLALAAAAILIAAALPCVAQAPPADPSFVKICDLYGSANSGAQAWHKDEACDLPNGFRLDTSYKQTNFSCCGGGAASYVTVNDIPRGIHVAVDGGHYWAVGTPVGLKTLEEDEDGRAIRRQFFIHTYCGPAGAPGPGCNIKVAVYAKRKQ